MAYPNTNTNIKTPVYHLPNNYRLRGVKPAAGAYLNVALPSAGAPHVAIPARIGMRSIILGFQQP